MWGANTLPRALFFMIFTDALLLVPLYGALAAGVFGAVYAPISLWKFFRSLADPGFSND